jgi:outer membrane lipoprotein-sorting protein
MLKTLITCLALAATTAAAETADEILADLDTRARTIHSQRAKATVRTQVNSPGYSYESTTKLTSEWELHDGKFLSRVESTTTTEFLTGEETTKTSSTSLVVNDGEFAWSEMAQGEMVTVTKMATQGFYVLPSKIMAPYEGSHEITVADDAEVDGTLCRVLEVRMKPVEGMPPQGQTTLYFGAEDGLLRKMLTIDGTGTQTSSTLLEEIETDIDIDDARFEYTPPKGVEVLDLTGAKPGEGIPGGGQ